MDPSIVEEMFKVADKDGDGEVDLDEFKAIMRAGPDSKAKAKARYPKPPMQRSRSSRSAFLEQPNTPTLPIGLA